MGVNLSIKNAPEDIVERLKARAARNHRSLQGELMSIIEIAAHQPERKDPSEVLADIRKLGIRSPSESLDMIRKMRDGG